ncbi:MAG: Bax inhibitor-1/YccA family protein [Inquilinus sp.]|nr:Bax inhibitor-1/YccA family protein [Inquilinus sp.]
MAFDPQNRAAPYAGGRVADRAVVDAGLRRYLLSVYNYMTTGLVISGLVAWAVANVPAVTGIFYVMQGGQPVSLNGLGMIAMWAPLAMLFGAMFMMRSPSARTAQGFYWAFVAINGVGLSILMVVYTGESLVRTFFIAASAFAALSLFGYTTKKDLSGFGSFLIMGLFGLIIAMVVNMFFASSMMQFVIASAGVLIFAGLTAYDTQRLKTQYISWVGGQGQEVQTVTAVFGALTLYITFLNLFQFLLMFLGGRE